MENSINFCQTHPIEAVAGSYTSIELYFSVLLLYICFSGLDLAQDFISFLFKLCTKDAAETYDKENGWMIHQNGSTPWSNKDTVTGFDRVPGNSEMLI